MVELWRLTSRAITSGILDGQERLGRSCNRWIHEAKHIGVWWVTGENDDVVKDALLGAPEV